MEKQQYQTADYNRTRKPTTKLMKLFYRFYMPVMITFAVGMIFHAMNVDKGFSSYLYLSIVFLAVYSVRQGVHYLIMKRRRAYWAFQRQKNKR